MIVTDSLFYDGIAMSTAQVQSFLNDKGSNCKGSSAPCLKSYSVATPATSAEAGLCAAMGATTSSSAAQIITQIGQACGISQKTILVMIQKESGIVTATNPTTSMYQTTTGFACPDGQPCDTAYYGFFNQVYRMARQFKVYSANPTKYGYQKGRNNSILYNPNKACGSAPVYVQNQATANLYIYTPYQPNAAALANLYGTGDSCSAYGNRNFWRLFNDWFGSTEGSGGGGSATTPTNSATAYIANSNTSVVASDSYTLGVTTSAYVACDWFNNGPSSIAGFDGGIWYLTNRSIVVARLGFGSPGDIPVCGDWTGGGPETLGVYRSSTATFYLRNSNSTGSANATISFGNTIGVYRPSTASFYLASKNAPGAAVTRVVFGDVGDRPVYGQFTSNGKDSIGVRRGFIYYLASTPGAASMAPFGFGVPADLPVFGDWNGDGIETVGVVRQ